MKILLLNNLHRKRGGADVVYFNTAELLKKAGHEVFFFSITTADMNDCPDSAFFAPMQEGDSPLKKMRNYCYNEGAAGNLQKLIDKVHPDIAHIHLIWGGLSPSVLITLHNNNIPVVHSVHDYRMICPAYTFRSIGGKVCEECKGGKYYNCFLKRCSKGNLIESAIMAFEMYSRNRKYSPCTLIDGFIFVSKFALDKHIEFDSRFANKLTAVLYNFWFGKDFLCNKKCNSYESYYLYYGRLSQEKGIRTLIKSFEKFHDLNLYIIGDGPLREELEGYCKEKDLTNITFKGYMSGESLYEAVQNAKFVCVPSEWYENNPMTIIESYSLGVPVIGANIGGIPEIIEDGHTGFIFESADGNDLSSVIKHSFELSEEEYLLLKKNARLFSEEKFSCEKYLPRLIAFYESVIQQYRNK